MPFSKVVLPVLPKPEHSKQNSKASVPLNAIEDKDLRKKLRNRQSALAARERKKARMLELEKQVGELQEQCSRIQNENQNLKKRMEILVKRCLRSGISLCDDNDARQLAKPIVNQPRYSPQCDGAALPKASIQSGCNQNNYVVSQKPVLPNTCSSQKFLTIEESELLQSNADCTPSVMFSNVTSYKSAPNHAIQRSSQSEYYKNQSSLYQTPFGSQTHQVRNSNEFTIEEKRCLYPENNSMVDTFNVVSGDPFNCCKSSQIISNANNISYSPSAQCELSFSADEKPVVTCSYNLQTTSVKRPFPSIDVMCGSPPKRMKKEVNVSSTMQYSCSGHFPKEPNENPLQQDQISSVQISTKPHSSIYQTNSFEKSQNEASLQKRSFSSEYNSEVSLHLPTCSRMQKSISMDENNLWVSREQQNARLISVGDSVAPINVYKTEPGNNFITSHKEINDNSQMLDLEDFFSGTSYSNSVSSKSNSDLSVHNDLCWDNDNLVFVASS